MSIYEYNEQEHIRMEREDAFEDGRKLGLGQGREEERTQMFTLMNKMTADGLDKQLSRLASDPDFYQEMMKKYLDAIE